MSSLTALIALSFATLIATLLAVWLTLTAGERTVRAAQVAQERPERKRFGAGRRSRRAELDNDAVRGARAPRKNAPVDAAPLPKADGDVRVVPRKRSGEDAFDRFLDPSVRRDDF
ncbi:MAG: hypothetical protein U5J97_10160 [Trueperaceae bacterium]|nr:hypothetical protein [Trueperaceae bacterium]